MKIQLLNKSHIKEMNTLYISSWKRTYKGILSDAFLENMNFDFYYEKWLKYITINENGILGAFNDKDELIGFCAYTRDLELDSTLYLDSLHISPDYQGKGIGTKLITELLNYCKKKNYNNLTICILTGNNKAKKLYCKLGATHLNFFDNYLEGTIAPSEKLIWILKGE